MKISKENGITHLDLHGVRHQDVSDEVIDFVFQYQNEIPLMIICGNVLALGNFLKKSSLV